MLGILVMVDMVGYLVCSKDFFDSLGGVEGKDDPLEEQLFPAQ